ncbi:hypothetical protein EBN03_33505 [Nocardia stercoris]|uniref:Uncharacterized protein n=1 Tax=Nocardia stercoris TaxID=2483361 RepID=A0A3M2KRB8_9NOCA|nr:hypothetical protein EBN03_33505 [Nocardia stercoris]
MLYSISACLSELDSIAPARLCGWQISFYWPHHVSRPQCVATTAGTGVSMMSPPKVSRSTIARRR